VVDGALSIVDEQGLAALTLTAVAQQSGVAVPSLYKHVRSLDALLQKASVVAITELAALMSDAVAGRAGLEALRSLAWAYRGYALTHPGRYPLTQRVPDADDPAHVAAAERAVGAAFAVLHAYGVEGAAAIDATRFIRAALHGFVILEMSGGFGIPQDVDRSFDRLVDGLDAALRSWPTT
jgi:AcrR family transcriptional regulator